MHRRQFALLFCSTLLLEGCSSDEQAVDSVAGDASVDTAPRDGPTDQGSTSDRGQDQDTVSDVAEEMLDAGPDDGGEEADASAEADASEDPGDPDLEWARSFSDGIMDIWQGGIALSSAGTVLVAANPSWTAHLDDGIQVHGSFLAEYDETGVLSWHREFEMAEPHLVAFAGGHRLVEGWLAHYDDFGNGFTNGPGRFLARYDESGALVFVRLFSSGTTTIQPVVLAPGPQDGAMMAGNCYGSGVDFGAGPLGGGGYAFIASFDAEGNAIWSKAINSTDSPVYVTGGGISPDGSTILAGRFMGTVDLGGGELTSAGEYDLFVAKFDPAGQHVFSKRFGSAADDQGPIVATMDDQGAAYIALDGGDPIDLGGGVLSGADAWAVVLARLDATGSHTWSARFGSPNYVHVAGLTSNDDQLWLIGSFLTTIDFGGGPLVGQGNQDALLAAFATTGEHIFSVSFGPAGAQDGDAVVVNSAAELAISGRFHGSVDLGPLQLQGQGQDVFVAVFAP